MYSPLSWASPDIRQRQQQTGDGIVKAFHFQLHACPHPRFQAFHARQRGEAFGQGFGCALQAGEYLGKPIFAVETVARRDQRIVGGERHHHGGHAAHDHRGDGQYLTAHVPEVTKQFAVEAFHVESAYQLSSRAAFLAGLRANFGNLAVGQADHAVGHVGDAGIVGDQHGQRAKFTIHFFQHLQHHHPGGRIERAGRLVAQQHGRILGDGARDRHPLLFAAGQLGREMVEPVAQPHQPQRLFRAHRRGRNFGHRSDVLACGEAGNQVIELEHEADVLAAKTREFGFGRAGQHVVEITHLAAAGRIEPAEDIQQRGFAAARRAEQHHQFTTIEREIDAAQRMHLDLAHAIDLGQSVGDENGGMRVIGCHATYPATLPHPWPDGLTWATATVCCLNQCGGLMCHLFQRARFLEQVGGAWNDEQLLFAAQLIVGLPD